MPERSRCQELSLHIAPRGDAAVQSCIAGLGRSGQAQQAAVINETESEIYRMEFNKTVSNPMLIGAIELMKAENTPEHKKMVSDEIVKAHFLSPVMVSPAPQPDAAGQLRLEPGSQVQFPVLTAPDGKQFFMAFTDMPELKKWKDEENQQTFSMSFDDYAGMLFKKDGQGNVSPASGFVINPFGCNIVVPREMVANYIAAKMAQAKAGQAPKGSQSKGVQPTGAGDLPR